MTKDSHAHPPHPCVNDGTNAKRPKGISKAERAGIVWPVARAAKLLHANGQTKRVAGIASIYFAGAMEGVARELIGAAFTCCAGQSKTRATAAHVMRAIRSNKSLHRVFANVAVHTGARNKHVAKALRTTTDAKAHKAARSATLPDAMRSDGEDTVLDV